jgi:hypothetical protein
MMADSLASKLALAEFAVVASFPSKPGCPKQKEAAREGHLRITAENDFARK